MDRKETVLVIDDHRESVEFLANYILRPAGFNISVAYDGEEGLRKALYEQPDLIIVDLKMPKLSGTEVLQALHKAQCFIPVILMTFHGSEEAAVQAFRLGAKDYLIKPYKPEEMHQAIERALIESRLRHERDELTTDIAAINRQMEGQVRELSILFSIGKSVTALLDQDRLLTRIVEAAVYITGAEEGFLLLVDEPSGELYMRAARGLGEKYARGFRLKVEDSLAGQVTRTGRPLMITGSRQGEQFKVKTGYLVKSLLHVPIKVGDTVIGVLSVDHMVEEKAFTEHDLNLLSAMADYAAIALENSRLYTQLQKQLTELTNKRSAPLPSLPPVSPSALEETQVKAFMEEGKAHLSGLREQVVSLEAWLGHFPPPLQTSAPSRAGAPQEATPAFAPGASPLLEPGLADILDSMEDGVLIVTPDDRISIANKAAEALLGVALVGKPAEEICDDPRWDKTYRIIQTASHLEPNTPGSEVTDAVTSLSTGGKTLRASFRAMPSQDHRPASILVTLCDVGAEQRAQRAKDSFVDSVSQELRTPVTTIAGYADLLLGGSVGLPNETQIAFLNRIRANASRLGGLLNDLVGMAQIDSQQLVFKAQVIDIVTIIQDAIKAFKPRVVEREQSLRVSMPSELPPVQADPDAVYHVVTSLLENAMHCSPERAVIHLGASRMNEGPDQYVRVVVTDQGGGIAPEDYKKVFNRFYRSDTPTIRGLGAPGVGFSVVKVLVEAHGGRVWLDSKLGQGSTFTFILPMHHSMPES